MKNELLRLGKLYPELNKHIDPILAKIESSVKEGSLGDLGFDFFDLDDDDDYVSNIHPSLSLFQGLKRGDTFRLSRKVFRVIKDQGIVKIVVVDGSSETKLFEAVPEDSREDSGIIGVYQIGGDARRVSNRPYVRPDTITKA